MLSFSVPTTTGFYDFTSESRSMLFAGSRHLSISSQTCHDLVSVFGSIGFSFLTGCANGVDNSFRLALSESDYADRTIIACAFESRRQHCYGLNSLVVSKDQYPKVALAKRTVWMVNTCSLAVLFPSDPIGKGTALAFRTAIKKNKPVFMVTSVKPDDNDFYKVLPSSLFGVVKGFWCIPYICHKRALCNEEKLPALV